MKKVILPRIDPGMERGKIVQWLKKEGDKVKEGEPIVKVEGEKTIFSVEAPISGILRKILAEEGEEVPVTQAIAIITAPGEEITEDMLPKDRIKISPAARRLAKEHGVDISMIEGTGPGGRIIREDVLRAIEAMKKEEMGPKVKKVVRIEGMRKTIARRMSESHRTIPAVTLVTEVDMTKALELREMLKEKSRRISITAMVVKAAALALEEDPILNSTVEDDRIIVYEDVNVGVAVSLLQGLVVPVIRNANKKSLLEISDEIEKLSRKAREEGLSPGDVSEGTFTVSNLGARDVEFFIPIINPPQSAILGVGTLSQRPLVIEGRLEIRPTLRLSLVFDHRVVDGTPASDFLKKIKGNLENPQVLLN